MSGDVPATEGTWASETMILTMFSRNHSVPTRFNCLPRMVNFVAPLNIIHQLLHSGSSVFWTAPDETNSGVFDHFSPSTSSAKILLSSPLSVRPSVCSSLSTSVCLSDRQTDRWSSPDPWPCRGLQRPSMYVGLFHACGMHLVKIICGFHRAHILWTDKCTMSFPGVRPFVRLSVWLFSSSLLTRYRQ